MGERKVTFPVIGTEHGETIRRNSETGVEIRSTKMDNGKSEHTVYAPGRDKMRLINYFETLSGAREEALDRAQDMREQISLSFDEAAAEADRREQAVAEAAARQARKLPTAIVGHRDVVTFAPGATVVPETIEGATDVSPWTLDLTGEIMHAPGGRIFVYVWQSFTHPTKGPVGRLAPVWLDELRTPGGAARVTIAGI